MHHIPEADSLSHIIPYHEIVFVICILVVLSFEVTALLTALLLRASCVLLHSSELSVVSGGYQYRHTSDMTNF